MFTKSLNSKGTYLKNGILLKDLTESIFKQLKYDLNVVFSYYKVSKELEMRPDKISKSLYGSDEYAEIVMKHSLIDNPFAIEEGDILIAPSLTTVYNNIKDIKDYETEDNDRGESTYDLIKNYHKYIDKSKLPSTNGSENNNVEISKDSANAYNNSLNKFNDNNISGKDKTIVDYDIFGNPIYLNNSSISSSNRNSTGEANLANNGNSGIYIKNGRIYFGKNVSASTENITDIKGTNKVDNNLVDCAKDGTTLGQFLDSIIKIN
jgi:hypothetical protein